MHSSDHGNIMRLERRGRRILRKEDPDHGLQQLGRGLAHARGVGWEEYWPFLGTMCVRIPMNARIILYDSKIMRVLRQCNIIIPIFSGVTWQRMMG